MDAKSKLMAYLKGWAHGAGRKAIQFQDQPDYMRGYQEGYDAYCKAATAAQEHYGAKLSVLRVQEQEPSPPCVHCGQDAQRLRSLTDRVQSLELANHELKVDLAKAVSLLHDAVKKTTWHLEEWVSHLQWEIGEWLKSRGL